MNIVGLYHRSDGILGYQLIDGSYKAILKYPKGVIKNISVVYDDPYNWYINEEQNIKYWKCENKNVQPIKIESDGTYNYATFVIKNFELRYKYAFVFDYQNKKYYYGEGGIIKSSLVNQIDLHQFCFNWNYSSQGKIINSNNWWKKTTFYQIFPDRFYNPENIKIKNELLYDEQMGGNIKGIITKLNYIQELGFNGIYLCPIFKASSNHKYDTIDYFQIDPAFGTLKDFDNLIKEVHKRDMKIMIDGVFNHCGGQHPFWQDVIKNKNKSKYRDWFIIFDINKIEQPNQLMKKGFGKNENEKFYSTFANVANMPRFNWSNPKVKDYICKIITFWSKRGIDAWRMDVADEVSFEMWRSVRQTFIKINPQGIMLGEIWYDAIQFLRGDQFDSTMNYNFRQNAIDFFIENKIKGKEFVDKIIADKYKYSEYTNASLLNLVSSHDTPRLLNVSKGDLIKYRFVLAWLLISDGVVSFYYGDEIESKGKTTQSNREPFNWNCQFHTNKTLKMVKKLLKFRNENIDKIIKGRNIFFAKNKIKICYDNNLNIEFDKLLKNIKINNEIINLT